MEKVGCHDVVVAERSFGGVGRNPDISGRHTLHLRQSRLQLSDCN